jgi:hypothetical protein
LSEQHLDDTAYLLIAPIGFVDCDRSDLAVEIAARLVEYALPERNPDRPIVKPIGLVGGIQESVRNHVPAKGKSDSEQVCLEVCLAVALRPTAPTKCMNLRIPKSGWISFIQVLQSVVFAGSLVPNRYRNRWKL